MKAPVVATLIKHKTDDGVVEYWEDVPIGKEYVIDLATIRVGRLLYFGLGYSRVLREIVRTDEGTWMPTECLDWPGKGAQ